jgi:hypothetical protein
MKKKIICFDLDNVLCRTIGSNYNKSKPIKKNINVVNKLFENGYYIKIFTARFMGRSNSIIKAKKQGYSLTMTQLTKWQINYHELIFGKPSYDIYIDDKSFFFDKKWSHKLEKELL